MTISQKFQGHQANKPTPTDQSNSALRGAFFMDFRMIKRLTVAVAALFALAGSALASGTIPYSLSQQLDQYGKPLTGCRLYVIQAGTTSTPQNAYQDAALTLPTSNPVICDSAGRLPQFFLADGTIKVRLTDKNGVNQVTTDGIQVIGPSGGGGGGGGTVDPTTVLQTGDVKIRYGSGIHLGFVRQNGRTIGSVSSGATERANSDCQPLFEYLWNTDSALAVSGGRGASSLADWMANKTIAMPDMRGRVPAASNTMGNSDAGVLSSSFCFTDTGVVGNVCGGQAKQIFQSNLPNATVGVTATGTASVLSTTNKIFQPDGLNGFTASVGSILVAGGNASTLAAVSSTGTASVTGSTSSINGGVTQQPLTTIQPTMILTFYQKL